MPVIQLKFNTNKKKNNRKLNNKNHSYVYNTRIWRKLRLYYLSKNPLCEKCKNIGKLTLAVEVHHIISISSVNTKEMKMQVGYNINNLMSLCKKCHIKIHNNE